MPSEYEDPAHAKRYLNFVAPRIPNREHGEQMILDILPERIERVLDIGTGDGRLLSLVLARRPGAKGVGMDISPTMLQHARERLGPDTELFRHDLAEPLPEMGLFDAVVSCFAIHHVDDPRKRALYAEVFTMLRPGGVFANLEHVGSPSDRLHRAFFDALGIPVEREDPSNQCAPVELQLGWLREIGFEDVDCYWKWRELAVLAGIRPANPFA